MRPPPPGVDAEIRHDGVTWTLRGRPGAAVIAQGFVAMGVAALAWGAMDGAALGLLGLAPLALGAWVGLQTLHRTTVTVSDRAVTVEARAPGGTTRTRVPLDEIEHAAVAHADGRVESRLVLRTREGMVVLGVGRPDGELDWALSVVDDARAAFARRESAEGREWTFLRKAPESLEKLRGS